MNAPEPPGGGLPTGGLPPVGGPSVGGSPRHAQPAAEGSAAASGPGGEAPTVEEALRSGETPTVVAGPSVVIPAMPGDDEPTTRGLPRVPGVRLDAEIGRGGFASVYRGHQISVDRDVAVKVDDRRLIDARDRRRFSREIIAAGAVSAHPHIVTLFDGGTTVDDHPYLVMELYPGGSYGDRMKSDGPIPLTEVLDVGFGIADALVAAHSEGILHRDVKPANILISRYGTAALADFGLAALPPAGEGYSVTMESLTPNYAAPEAFGGTEPTVSIDIYALGATLYAMLQGRSPRSDELGQSPPITRLLVMLNEPLPPLQIPGTEGLMPVIWRATAVDPADRYPTAAALRDALAAVRAGHPGAAGGLRPFPMSAPGRSEGDDGPPPGRGHRGPPTGPDADPTQQVGGAGDRKRRGPLLAVVAAVVVVLLVVGAFLIFRPGGNQAGGSTGTGSNTAGSATTTPPVVPPVSASGAPTTGSRLGQLAGTDGSISTRATTTPAATAPTSSPTAPSSTPGTSTTGSPTSSVGTSQVVATTAAPVTLVPGTCWKNLVSVSRRTSATEVGSCAVAHKWGGFAGGKLSAGTTFYDQSMDADPVVQRTCFAQTDSLLKKYVGAGSFGDFDVRVLGPSEAAYSQGARTFLCLAQVHSDTPGGDVVTGSIKG